MSNILIAAALFFAAFFPTENSMQSLVANAAFLVGLPLLFVRVFLRESFSDFGLGWGDIHLGLIWFCALTALVGGSVFATIYFLKLSFGVIIPLSVRESFVLFLVYIALTGAVFLIQEIFFRGFVLHVWKRRFKGFAVLLQAFFSVLPSVFRLQTIVAKEVAIGFVLALCSGWIVYRSRSIWYAFFFSYISVILLVVATLIVTK